MSEDQEIHPAELSGRESSKEPTVEPRSLTDSNEDFLIAIASPSPDDNSLARSPSKTDSIMLDLQPHLPTGPPPPGGAWLAARQRQHVHRLAGTRACTPSEEREIDNEEVIDPQSTEPGWDEDSAVSGHDADLSLRHSNQGQKRCCANAGHVADALLPKIELHASQNSSRFDQRAAQDEFSLVDCHDADSPTLEYRVSPVIPRSATTDPSGTTGASGSLELWDTIPVSSKRRASSSKAELRRKAPSAGQKLDAPASRDSSKSASRSAWPTMEDLSSSEWDVLESILGKKSKDRSEFQKNLTSLQSTRPTTLPLATCLSPFSASPPGSAGPSPRAGSTVPSTPSHPLTLPRILSPTFQSPSRMR